MTSALSEISRITSQSSPIPIKACSHCGDTDKRLSVCGRCHIEKYCNRACQASAWPKHKQVCVQSTKKEPSVKPISTDTSKTMMNHRESTSIVDAHLILSKEKPTPIVKSKDEMTAREYASTLTAADARLPYFPYRPKGLPESCWGQQETYYLHLSFPNF